MSAPQSLFLTYAHEDPDMDAGDRLKTTGELDQRQTLISNWLDGNARIDDVCDLLVTQGYDADHWLDDIIDNMQAVYEGGVPYVELDSGLLVPTR